MYNIMPNYTFCASKKELSEKFIRHNSIALNGSARSNPIHVRVGRHTQIGFPSSKLKKNLEKSVWHISNKTYYLHLFADTQIQMSHFHFQLRPCRVAALTTLVRDSESISGRRLERGTVSSFGHGTFITDAICVSATRARDPACEYVYVSVSVPVGAWRLNTPLWVSEWVRHPNSTNVLKYALSIFISMFGDINEQTKKTKRAGYL